MERTLLYEAFASLGKSERREFGKFVRSPFFNQKAHPTALYEYLCECLDGRRQPAAAEAFSRLWSGQPYDDQRMRLANSARSQRLPCPAATWVLEGSCHDRAWIRGSSNGTRISSPTDMLARSIFVWMPSGNPST